ncbi:MAG TPA: sugar phosphate isomerase/epimerase, partial [Devosia sp.]|nr:sugar phosphate isomerase/epimerase [Devosia sp.]
MSRNAISLNLATTRQVWGFKEAVDGCLRAGITAISPWRD